MFHSNILTFFIKSNRILLLAVDIQEARLEVLVGKMNSHIRMPKCVLKQFEDEKHFVYFWNLEKGWIQNSHAESINTEKGYYSESVERFLRDNIETPFGHILKFIKSIDMAGSEFTMDNTMKTVMRRFVYALAARSKKMMEGINETSVYYQFMPKRDQHDIAAVLAIEEAERNQLFSDWEITFTANHTAIPFVLPLCGSASFSFNGDVMFNLPVTPHYAITFMQKAVANKYIIDGKMRMFLVTSEDQAMRYNTFAFTSEQRDGNYGLASNSRDILEKMKSMLTK